MSLKPIDYQVMLPKVSEVSRDMSGQLAKYNVLQKQKADRLNENAQEGQKKVRDRENAEKVRISEHDNGRNNSNQDERKRKNREKQGKNDENRKHDKAGTIDIRL